MGESTGVQWDRGTHPCPHWLCDAEQVPRPLCARVPCLSGGDDWRRIGRMRELTRGRPFAPGGQSASASRGTGRRGDRCQRPPHPQDAVLHS